MSNEIYIKNYTKSEAVVDDDEYCVKNNDDNMSQTAEINSECMLSDFTEEENDNISDSIEDQTMFNRLISQQNIENNIILLKNQISQRMYEIEHIENVRKNKYDEYIRENKEIKLRRKYKKQNFHDMKQNIYDFKISSSDRKNLFDIYLNIIILCWLGMIAYILIFKF